MNPTPIRVLPHVRAATLRIWLPVVAAIALTGVTVFSVSRPPREIGLKVANAPSTIAHDSRLIFRNSVIPGGARSAVELRQALLRDKVAANHYADFDVSRTQVEYLKKARDVYVSYRVADRIYWTRTKRRLPKGEAILSDGVNCARTRCGNRIADSPQQPVAKVEPSEEVLNSSSPKPLKLEEMADNSHLLGKEQLGQSIGPPSGDLTAFAPALSPSAVPSSFVAAPGGFLGGGPGGTPGGGGGGVGMGGVLAPPQSTLPPVNGITLPVPQPTGPAVPVSVPLPTAGPVGTNFPTGVTPPTSSSPVLTTPPPSALPLPLPGSPIPVTGSLPGISLPGNVVSPPGFDTFSPTPAFFPPENGTVPSGSSASAVIDEIASATTTKPLPVNVVNVPEPGTVAICLIGTVLLFFGLKYVRTRRPVPR